LYYAAWNGHKDICSLLLEKGADITATNEASDAEIDRCRACMPSRAHTYIHLPAPRPPETPISATVHNVSCILYILPAPLCTPVPPHPSSRTLIAAIIAWNSVYAHYHQWVGMYVREPGYLCMGYVCMFEHFAISDSLLWPH
jgi:hypothetical protein